MEISCQVKLSTKKFYRMKILVMFQVLFATVKINQGNGQYLGISQILSVVVISTL